MLVRYPGLTVVGGLALSFAIASSAAFFEFVGNFVHPRLGFEGGDRLVGVRLWDAASGKRERRALHDFVRWREGLARIEGLGAYRTVDRNLIVEGDRGEPVRGAEMSASGFRLAGIPAQLGRVLLESDERSEASPVVVLGHDLWQARFGADPNVVGQIVGLGRVATTVVGVMPEGFGFPVSHNLWAPFRMSTQGLDRLEGPGIGIFGALAAGVTLDQAQAELTAEGLRMAAEFPDTHQHLRPEVLPYARSIVGLSRSDAAGLLSVNVFMVLFLVLVCGNVALLVFARAATRDREIVVRNALGASRGQIVSQLFTEALVLGGLAALFGLVAAEAGLSWTIGQLRAAEGVPLPFWFRDRLAPTTLVYTALLTVLVALLAGVVPALKLTRGVEARLRRVAGSGGVRFGGLWTAVIVAQVAVTVTGPATAFFVRRDVAQIQALEVGFPAEEYLSVRLEMDPLSSTGAVVETSSPAFVARFRSSTLELSRRLTSEPGITGVTFVDHLPHTRHPQLLIDVEEVDEEPLPVSEGHRVSVASADASFFEVLGAPILFGRGFDSGDLHSGRGVVVVNKSLVEGVLGGRTPIGRRVRFQNGEDPASKRPSEGRPGPWYEVVGVVRDLGMTTGGDPTISGAGIYFPKEPGAAYPVHMAMHVRGEPEAFASRLRSIATAVDPSLRLYDTLPMDEIHRNTLREYGLWLGLTLLVSSVAMLLSLAAIYAVTSFTVSRRTREIGIRVALGSDPRSIIAAILRRPLAQVGAGVVAGGGLVAALVRVIIGALSPREVGFVVAYALFMLAVCLLACLVPTRRALRVEPTEALRADG